MFSPRESTVLTHLGWPDPKGDKRTGPSLRTGMQKALPGNIRWSDQTCDADLERPAECDRVGLLRERCHTEDSLLQTIHNTCDLEKRTVRVKDAGVYGRENPWGDRRSKPRRTHVQQILGSLQATLEPNPKHVVATLTHISELDDIVAERFRQIRESSISLAGRALPLLYQLVTQLLSLHSFTVLVIDPELRFDVTSLNCPWETLVHLYIHRPASGCAESPQQLQSVVLGAVRSMLYGDAASTISSGARRWWGVIIIGGSGAGDVTTSWKGWLHVHKEEVDSFPQDTNALDAVRYREVRQKVVYGSKWVARSHWGSFSFSAVDEET